MGLITWAIAVLALILGSAALYLQVSAPAIDFQECSIINSGSPSSPQQTSCNDICDEKTCVLGLSKFNEQITISEIIESSSQESLLSCSDVAPYGRSVEDEETESYSISCVCCN